MIATGICVLGALLLVAGCGSGSDEEYADRMATEHEADRPVPGGLAASAVDPSVAIDESEVTYATVNDNSITGFLARPAEGDGKAGVIVIQEWWGLNDNIRAMARRLAAEGYVALAVDLYEGQVAEESARARELMSAAMERAESLEDNLRQAHRYLGEQGAESIGVIGWCFGGGWSLRTALLLPDEIDATVIYYGRLVTDSEQLAALESPILGLFGSEDQGIPLESVREFESVLESLGKDAAIHVYEGANHAFANPSGTRYNADAAEDAWKKTLEFFTANLK
jgi:carboxymethylenebutenolidase